MEKVDKETGEKTIKRIYETIPLNVVIERQKRGLSSVPEDKDGNPLKFVLSPNDLVYVPTREEIESGHIIYPLDRMRIYKMVSCTGNRLYLIPHMIASMIVDKVEYTKLNKVEFSDDKRSIKEICIPIKVDRLGNLMQLL